MRERLIWIFAGLLGLLLAAALASATSRVTRPDVGLAGEPVSAGEALAPAATTTAAPRAALVKAKAKAKRAKKRARKARKSSPSVTVAAAPRHVTGSTTSKAFVVAPRASTPANTTTAKKKPRSPAAVATLTRPKVVTPILPRPATRPVVTVPDVSGRDGGDGADRSGKGGGGGDD